MLTFVVGQGSPNEGRELSSFSGNGVLGDARHECMMHEGISTVLGCLRILLVTDENLHTKQIDQQTAMRSRPCNHSHIQPIIDGTTPAALG